SFGTGLARGEEGVHAGTAAQVDDAFAGCDRGESEVVADSGKGLDGFGRYGVQFGSRVAEPFREDSSHLEVKLTVRRLGDRPVHDLDLVSELVNVDSCHQAPPASPTATSWPARFHSGKPSSRRRARTPRRRRLLTTSSA